MAMELPTSAMDVSVGLASAQPFSLLPRHPPFPSRSRRRRKSLLPQHTLSLIAAHASHVERKKSAVVVGGGWAGFGAAHALAKAGLSVTLLDAAPHPGGLSTGFRTPQGRPVEAGIKGFWWQYHNIYELVRELDIAWPFTDWTRSSFYSPSGIQVQAPVFNHLPRLPAPLGSFFYTFPYFRSLSLVDRLTAFPLIKALIEFDLES